MRRSNHSKVSKKEKDLPAHNPLHVITPGVVLSIFAKNMGKMNLRSMYPLAF
jgi:hypothetical protein